MNDLGGHRYPGAKAKLRQVFLQKAGAARHVRAGEFRAVARFGVVRAPQVTDVVEQPDDEPHDRALAAERGRFGLHPLVPHNEACERERYV
jgi:hypothetical protein